MTAVAMSQNGAAAAGTNGMALGSTHRMENGRRYHGFLDGAYMYPNDEKEQDRLDFFDHIFKLARNDDLHRAPIARNHLGPTRVLDLGTGTGIWVMQMADKYSELPAEIIGVDISLIQPKWIPRNARFMISDFESEWSLGRNSFDLIHLRGAMGAISHWPSMYRRIFEHLKPGYGWFEGVEIDPEPRSSDGSLHPNSQLKQWYNHLADATDRSGKTIRYQHNTEQMLTDAGFEEIQHVTIPLALGGWPSDPHLKNVGRAFVNGFVDGLEGFSLGPLSRIYRWSAADIKNLTEGVKNDIRDRRLHAYMDLHIWIARRPMGS